MNEFKDCYQALSAYEEFSFWAEKLPLQIEHNFQFLKHGDLVKWQDALTTLAQLSIKNLSYQLSDTIQIGKPEDLNTDEKVLLEKSLQNLCPWRKGPFNFFGLTIDTEWRSDWKWQRLQNKITPLRNKKVLDVGCGSGYHLWRMREAGAEFVLGIDPSLLFWQQFLSVKNFLAQEPVYYLPLRSEDLPEKLSAFDTVFSMGVLYHRRSPLDHLIELRNVLVPNGELVLETLIIESEGQNVLLPSDRYAMMRNVFFLPSIELLIRWLERCGFIDIKVLDINQTSCEEQRVTEWVKAQSLKDFLNPNDHNLTIEGYPAPLRACLSAKKDPKFQ